ncbi:Crp/Fnr family transcriptional regulator [Sinorhizobium americanum]|uniref:CAP/Crp family transcriptional regulator n=1 Tax=Sinorhizobium americanum TaxID=194963 RepID=A0A1L3LPZ8_9HYPH|nr:Crp/Fnr family transcriptional regulator [Sinorhizobium americanum]APG92103.1 CAP/Crp family transcriptional regulator [Sinorhizobium americanum]OAP34749.1 Crp/Fnr family transcriptional regulator [Sinorhizobium americanum]TCN32554.1 CRP-like cAMP-binding protein [Sinorhizobium americanum]
MKTLRLTSSDRAILLNARFFSRLPRTAIEAIVEGATVSTHETHDTLFRQDDPLDDVLVVLSGLVRLYRLGKDGREADVAVFPRGELIGVNAIFLDRRATANAQAAEPSIIARLEGAKLRRLAAEDTAVAQALLELLCHHGKLAEDCLAEDRLLTAPQRVANYILSHCPNGSESFSFRLPFQKSVLAGKLGLAPEALSRAFSTLRQSGVVVKGRVIEIRDRQALEQF